MPTYGYARVSTTEGQDLKPQRVALQAAGCGEIIDEMASGTDRTCPELAHFVDRLRRGDTLVLVRIDRLARSPSGLDAWLPTVRRLRPAAPSGRGDRRSEQGASEGGPPLYSRPPGARRLSSCGRGPRGAGPARPGIQAQNPSRVRMCSLVRMDEGK